MPATALDSVATGDMEMVQSMYDFQAVEKGGLSFGKGDLIQVLNKLPSGWWDGIALKSGVRGWFPSNYVQV